MGTGKKKDGGVGKGALLAKRKEGQKDRWGRITIDDLCELTEAEEHMIQFFRTRELKELDKQCWLIE